MSDHRGQRRMLHGSGERPARSSGPHPPTFSRTSTPHAKSGTYYYVDGAPSPPTSRYRATGGPSSSRLRRGGDPTTLDITNTTSPRSVELTDSRMPRPGPSPRSASEDRHQDRLYVRGGGTTPTRQQHRQQVLRHQPRDRRAGLDVRHKLQRDGTYMNFSLAANPTAVDLATTGTSTT